MKNARWRRRKPARAWSTRASESAPIRSPRQVFSTEETWDYFLETDENGDFFFEAVCGTVAIYTIQFKLNEEEIFAWKTDGVLFLQHLIKVLLIF